MLLHASHEALPNQLTQSKHLPLNAAKFSLQNIKVYDNQTIKIRWECFQDITSVFLCHFL